MAELSIISMIKIVVPTLLLMGVTLWFDKDRTKPAGLLLKAFLCGMIALGVFYFAWVYNSDYFLWANEKVGEGIWGNLRAAFLYSALCEETLKLLMLWIVLNRNSYYNNPYDGILYAVFVGMGFAMADGFIQGSVCSILCHFLCAWLMGYLFSWAKFKRISGWKRGIQLLLIWLVPLMLHGIMASALLLFGS